MKKILTFLITTLTSTAFGQVGTKQNPSDFVPKGYVVFEKVIGDLNKDGMEDCVLLIKGTDKSKIVTDEFKGRLDRNRRGIIVLLKQKEYYEPVVKNYDCFSSENEDGGVYYPPELSIEIEKGNLYIQYRHGRYGYWQYTFRHQNLGFELIGYDLSANRGPVTQSVTSINFLTKKKLTKDNINKDKENSDEEYVEDVFVEKWEKIKIEKLLKLSEIKDFDKLDMSIY